ncbi:MAG: hypothetical protein OXE99_07430 [Cellvibrionales bacterium]|nr:hypothetical protein [Cellvibrionales bacterium]
MNLFAPFVFALLFIISYSIGIHASNKSGLVISIFKLFYKGDALAKSADGKKTKFDELEEKKGELLNASNAANRAFDNSCKDSPDYETFKAESGAADKAYQEINKEIRAIKDSQKKSIEGDFVLYEAYDGPNVNDPEKLESRFVITPDEETQKYRHFRMALTPDAKNSYRPGTSGSRQKYIPLINRSNLAINPNNFLKFSIRDGKLDSQEVLMYSKELVRALNNESDNYQLNSDQIATYVRHGLIRFEEVTSAESMRVFVDRYNENVPECARVYEYLFDNQTYHVNEDSKGVEMDKALVEMPAFGSMLPFIKVSKSDSRPPDSRESKEYLDFVWVDLPTPASDEDVE